MPYTIGQTLSWLENCLENAGDINPRLSSQMLMCSALNLDRPHLYLNIDREIDTQTTNKIRDFATRRSNKEPLQYITGKADFAGITFAIKPGVLIPRPETEILVEECVRYLKIHSVVHNGGLKANKKLYCIDLCTGSGCVAVSIVKNYPNSKFLATDISNDAVSCAIKNITKFKLSNKIEVLQGDLEKPILDKYPASNGKIDLIVSNPPYVPTKIYENLPDEVAKFEPRNALLAGNDGLDMFRRIVNYAKVALRPGGMLAVELYEDSLNKAKNIVTENGFINANIINDLTYRPRILTAILQ